MVTHIRQTVLQLRQSIVTYILRQIVLHKLLIDDSIRFVVDTLYRLLQVFSTIENVLHRTLHSITCKLSVRSIVLNLIQLLRLFGVRLECLFTLTHFLFEIVADLDDHFVLGGVYHYVLVSVVPVALIVLNKECVSAGCDCDIVRRPF